MEATEIDRELEELQSKTELLRALYEQYFMGFERMEPLVQRKDVERRVRSLRREQIHNTAQRFRLNTLVQRLNTMQQHWARVVREIENGTYRRDVLKAAARFGEGALTVLGQKKTRDLAAAVAKAETSHDGAASGSTPPRPAEGLRSIGETSTVELAADDLLEDDDAAPTPPKPGKLPPAMYGLGQGDLPVVGSSPGPENRLPQPAAAPARPVRPRWERDAAPPPQPVAAFGELDLDFDAPPSDERSPPAPPPAGAAPRVPVKPPGPQASPNLGLVRSTVPKPPAANAPPKPPTAPAFSAGFGTLDLTFEEDEPFAALVAPPAVPRPAPTAKPSVPRPIPKPSTTSPVSSSGSGIRPGGAPSQVTSPPRPPATAAPMPGGPSSELPDQRLRQIYVQYIDTKRSTREPTDGVTFEKLAASLRAQADKLKSAHPNKSVDYEVVVKDGKTHLKPVLR